MLSSSINLQWPPFIQRAASDILTDYGPFVFGNRPVRTRTPGGVGAGGENPPATRLGNLLTDKFLHHNLCYVYWMCEADVGFTFYQGCIDSNNLSSYVAH